MPLKVQYFPHLLSFRFKAGTSRGVLTDHHAYFLKVTDDEQPGVVGIGEASPLPGLSPDHEGFEQHLRRACQAFNRYEIEAFSWNIDLILNQLVESRFPAVRFGLETALLDFVHGGRRLLFDNEVSRGERPLTTNGLVWMNTRGHMQAQLDEKLAAGFRTIKLKVGALDFQDELDCLAHVRERFSVAEVGIRLDANGAWTPDEATEKLAQLAAFGVHSVEQPIRPGQPEALARLCASSPIPVALDEELIGVYDYVQKLRLLKSIRPAFIVLKPTLLGGFAHCREWIELAHRMGAGWWLTSALESNVALNAIAQFAGEFQNPLPQGLGTGGLYHNNVISPLELTGEQLRLLPGGRWGYPYGLL